MLFNTKAIRLTVDIEKYFLHKHQRVLPILDFSATLLSLMLMFTSEVIKLHHWMQFQPLDCMAEVYVYLEYYRYHFQRMKKFFLCFSPLISLPNVYMLLLEFNPLIMLSINEVSKFFPHITIFFTDKTHIFVMTF